MNLITDLWRFAAAGSNRYCDCLPPGVTTFTMGNGLDSARVWENDTRIVVSWAGTKGTGPDWIQNFCVMPNSDGIHQGYAASAREFITRDFRDYLLGASGKELHFTGHSQGAAQACVVAWYLSRDYRIHVPLIVHYGGPIWGMNSAVALLERMCAVTRVVAGHDPVEISRFPFRREGARVHIPGCFWGRWIGALDHDYPVYTRGLRTYSQWLKDQDGVEAMNKMLKG